MTLCIAAVSRRDKRIVTVSDLMLSTEEMSSEPSISKVIVVGKQTKWMAMFAGDPTHAWSIIDRACGLLDNKSESFYRVMGAFKTAYQDELENKINSEILSPLGLTRTSFLKDGRSFLGDETFNKLYYEVLNTSLETDFLVGNSSRLFSIEHPCTVTYHDPLGFSAIGAGATLAEASLTGILDPNESVENIIYRLLEAKFRGESARGVGRKTFVVTMDDNGKVESLPMSTCEEIRQLWEEKGKAKIPSEVNLLIAAFLKPENPKSRTGAKKRRQTRRRSNLRRAAIRAAVVR